MSDFFLDGASALRPRSIEHAQLSIFEQILTPSALEVAPYNTRISFQATLTPLLLKSIFNQMAKKKPHFEVKTSGGSSISGGAPESFVGCQFEKIAFYCVPGSALEVHGEIKYGLSGSCDAFSAATLPQRVCDWTDVNIKGRRINSITQLSIVFTPNSQSLTVISAEPLKKPIMVSSVKIAGVRMQ